MEMAPPPAGRAGLAGVAGFAGFTGFAMFAGSAGLAVVAGVYKFKSEEEFQLLPEWIWEHYNYASDAL